MVLSPIEQGIKRKIEAVGTPLKEWDIQINYGIKTGYNDAFIISTSRHDEILSRCQTDDERRRTADLIRPILRGRDIKRYGYEWAGLWVINAHNGIKGKIPRVDIDEYPAVKAHLDQYWGGISKRTDKGDTPYNLRNCAYMGDFCKPKIVWKIIGSKLAFTLENEKYFVNNACYLMTGEHLLWMLPFLNSAPLIWYSEITNMNKTGVGDAQVGAQNIVLFPIPQPCDNRRSYVETLALRQLSNPKEEQNLKDIAATIYSIYGLDEKEVLYLESLDL